ncbi:MAG TPA: transposase, partial [Spirochaetota bacterium]|nr:transposase [Spirochaetota bacterium]
FDKTKTKRKKEGVFYTPKYITKYIVENTLGALCDEKKKELGLIDIDLDTTKDYKRLTKDKKELLDRILQYRDYLLSLKILDPACGSGAFLIQVLDYLIREHQFIETYRKSLEGDFLGFYEIEKTILEHNIYGVDINEEAVEIAKLSLWLRTAEKGRKLNDLSEHIKCGNSLIDDSTVAGEKAFKWEEEFPEIIGKKEKNVEVFHITWVTHNSRISERMIEYNVKKGEPFVFTDEQEIYITEILKNIIVEEGYKILAYNICKDHIHILIACNPKELPNIIKKLKGKSSQKFKEWLKIPSEEEFHLWAQKYDEKEITDDNRFENTINYINNNRTKHQLQDNKGLQPLVTQMTCAYENAFNQFEDGGFDVVIGNPPYVRQESLNKTDKEYFIEKYKNVGNGIADLYVYFYELGLRLLKKGGYLSYISPNKWMERKYGFELRKYLKEFEIIKIMVLNLFTGNDKIILPH